VDVDPAPGTFPVRPELLADTVRPELLADTFLHDCDPEAQAGWRLVQVTQQPVRVAARQQVPSTCISPAMPNSGSWRCGSGVGVGDRCLVGGVESQAVGVAPVGEHREQGRAVGLRELAGRVGVPAGGLQVAP